MNPLRQRAARPVICATCELEVMGPPVRANGGLFCCAGCAAGGPCSCTYDHDDPPEVSAMSSTLPMAGPSELRQPLPMTRACFLRLEAELGRLGPALRDAESRHRQTWHGDAPELVAGTAVSQIQQLEHRLDALRQVLTGVEIVEPDGLVVLGSEVVVREADGSVDAYQIVVPSEADPLAGRISYASPMGRALLGRRAGQVVTVSAPAGAREVTLVSVAVTVE